MFAERLKERRQAANKTQKEMADFLGITVQSYQRYELGTREPDFKVLVMIAVYFNVATDYLLGRTDEPTPAVIEGNGLKEGETAIPLK